MANQNDSFIDEVTEDLRRDRLFAAFRRYGWIALLLILAIVGGAVWREVTLANRQAEAERWGDAVLAAEAMGDPAALASIDPEGSVERDAVAGLLAAAAWVDSGGSDAAAEILREVGAMDLPDRVLQDLAQLKLVMLTGETMDPSERDAILSRLSRAGAPFELLALEQKAVALIEAGRIDDAATLIGQIQQKDGLSQALRQRLSEMMIAIGVVPEPTDLLPTN